MSAALQDNPWLLAGAALCILAWGLWMYRWRWRREVKRCAEVTQRLSSREAILASAPLGCIVLEGKEAGAFGNLAALFSLDAAPPDLDSVREALSVEDGARLSHAVDGLRRRGIPFDLTVERSDGSRFFAARSEIAATGPTVWFIDVTAQETARREAKARDRRWRDVFDHLPYPVWRRDSSLTVQDCNESYATAVGMAKADALTSGTELLGEHQTQAAPALARRATASGKAARESHHAVIGGSRCLLELTETPLPDGSTVGSAVDRTRVEELQEDLARHISAHGEVLETLGTAIVIYGPDLRLKFYNGAYAAMWGLSEGFLDSEPHISSVMEALRELRSLPEQTDFPAFRREVIQAMRNLVRPSEELMHRPDGSTLKVTMSPHPFGGVIVIYEDVTDRLTLERSFNTLIDVQRATIDNLYEAVAVFGSDGRLSLYNQAYAQLWEHSEEQLAEQPHVRWLTQHRRRFFDVPDSRWPEIVESIVANASEPEARAGRLDRADGKVLQWAQVPLPNGQSLFTYLDVTDSTTVERALRDRTEALETADRLKSEFIANISYELRTPLNAIVGFAEILENQFFGTLNTRQQEYATAIVQSSQRLIGLINDILDLATIEAGYMELELEEVDVAGVMRDLHTIAHERAHSRGIHFELDCPSETGTVVADNRRIKQALFNLLSNAINFTPEGGRVTLIARREEKGMCLAVSDTGIGMPPEETEQVFERFVRAHPRKSGAGLGLALVKSLIELHGGTVEIDSSPNRGTCVTCHLPFRPNPPAPRQLGAADQLR